MADMLSLSGFDGAIRKLLEKALIREIPLGKSPSPWIVDTLTNVIDSENNFLGYPIAAVKKKATKNGIESVLLSLPGGETTQRGWPINSSLPYKSSSILIPPRLSALANMSLDAIELLQSDHVPNARYHLEGTAGLGKSVFAQILIHECVTRYGKRSVVLVYQPIPTSSTVFIYSSARTFIGETMQDILWVLQCGWRSELELATSRKIFWIFDSHVPISLVDTAKNAALILISSMGAIWDSAPLKKWCRVSANIRLIMSQWDFTDLEALRIHCFPHVSAGLLKRRYSLFGGNPRSILEMAGDHNYEEKLGATIETIDI
jgi:hypothetical protein